MRAFLQKLLIYGIIFMTLNVLIGVYLKSFETGDLVSQGTFFPQLRWDDYKKHRENIDVLILGSSHAYRSYDPKVIETELSSTGRIFNFGSSAQSPAISYFVQQEVLNSHQPKLVVFDIYFLVFGSDELLENGLINWRLMPEGAARRQFFKEGFSFAEQTAITLFPSYVYRKYLKPKIKKLLGLDYLLPAKGRYQGDGFVSSTDTLAMKKLQYGNQFDRFETSLDNISKKNIDYLRRIVESCKARDIPIVFTVAPIPGISVQKIKNYSKFSQYFEALASDLAVPYYDFNIHRVPSIKDEFHYYDDDHLNQAGATNFSIAVSKVIQDHMKK
jgi:hypothetical protein